MLDALAVLDTHGLLFIHLFIYFIIIMANLNNETKVYHSCTALRAYVRVGQSLAGLHTNARCTSSVGYPWIIIYLPKKENVIQNHPSIT